jgi:hypothetical protein
MHRIELNDKLYHNRYIQQRSTDMIADNKPHGILYNANAPIQSKIYNWILYLLYTKKFLKQVQ